MYSQSLAQQIAAFLMPLLPYLAQAGEKAAEEIGKKMAGEAWEQAKALWGKLRRKKKIEQVAQTAFALPDNQTLREALAEVVQQVLAEGGNKIQDIVQEAEGGPTTQELRASDHSTIKGVRQIQRMKGIAPKPWPTWLSTCHPNSCPKHWTQQGKYKMSGIALMPWHPGWPNSPVLLFTHSGMRRSRSWPAAPVATCWQSCGCLPRSSMHWVGTKL